MFELISSQMVEEQLKEVREHRRRERIAMLRNMSLSLAIQYHGEKGYEDDASSVIATARAFREYLAKG
jgi:hypothetical protein